MTDRISQRVSSLFLLILTVLISNMADSATHFVDASASAGGDGSSWGTAFVSISEATSAAAAGDEILVKYGTYQEENGLAINKDLKISSDDGTNATFADAKPKPGSCILSGDGTTLGTNGMLIQGQVSNETIIQGLTIFGYGAGAYLFGQESNPPKPVLRNLIFTQNLQNAIKSARAIFTVERCLIVDNVYADRLFYLFFGGEATVKNCTFVGNIGAYPVIQSFAGGNAVIENVLIWGNRNSFNDTPSTGIDPAGQNYIVKNSLVEGGYATGVDIIDSNPLFADASLGDFRLLKESPAIGAGIEGSDIGAFSFVPPPPLDHKVRKRLKERFFGGLPETPEMSDFNLEQLKNITELPLDMIGNQDEILVLDSFNEYLPELDYLDLYSANIDSLGPLDGHPNLRRLHLKRATADRSWEGIFTKENENGGGVIPISLPNLEMLNMDETGFKGISQLRHYTGLKRLSLSNNSISSQDGDLDGLEDLVNLEYLDLRHNPNIRDISDLKKLAEAKIRADIDREHGELGINDETEMKAAPSANQSALDHEEWHQPRPFWTVMVEGTSISSDQVGELLDLGVRVFDLPQMGAQINLLSGTNMIGLPLDVRERWHAKRLVDHLRRHNIHWENSLPISSATELATAPAVNQSALDHDRAYFMSPEIQPNLMSSALNLGWSPEVRAALQGRLDGLEGYGPNNVQCMYRIIPVGDWVWNLDSGALQSLESTLHAITDIGSIKQVLDSEGLAPVYDYILKVRAVWDEIPDDPDNGNYWSQSLEAQFSPSPDGPQLIRYRDVSWIVHHDPVTQNFNTFIPEFDHNSDGFPIQGGEGYIVQVGSNRQVSFYGQAWTGYLGNHSSTNSEHSVDTQEAPNLIVNNHVWAFMVTGELTRQMVTEHDVYQLRATNLTSGKQLASVQHQGYNFRLPLVDMSQQQVVAEGDIVKIEVINSTGQRIGESRFTVSQQEIATAYRIVRIRYNPIPEFSRVLQNYPNPFNPETWMPFELSQDAEVSITIYDVSGQLVRTLDIGFQSAGIYSSQDKAAYWDGKTETGEKVASGVYFYNIELGDYSETRRMVILK